MQEALDSNSIESFVFRRSFSNGEVVLYVRPHRALNGYQGEAVFRGSTLDAAFEAYLAHDFADAGRYAKRIQRIPLSHESNSSMSEEGGFENYLRNLRLIEG